MFRSIVIFLLLSFTAAAWAQNDSSYIDYLQKNGLKAEDCAAHAPDEWFRTIQQREHVGFGGTPGHGATTMDVFYRKYRDALQSYNDAHHAEAAKARTELRKLFYHLSDGFECTVPHRTYITHERIDAFVEYLIGQFRRDASSLEAYQLDLSVEDAATFLRTQWVLRNHGELNYFDLDEFRSEAAAMLRHILKQCGAIDSLTLNAWAVRFADQYPDLLEPWR